MHVVAGNFTSSGEARRALRKLREQGFDPQRMTVIQPDDRKGFVREHKTNRVAVRRGAAAGVMPGIVFFAILIWIAGAPMSALRLIALSLSGIAFFTAAGAVVGALWNMGHSHDEALLFEEARSTGVVIAAVETPDPLENEVIASLRSQGARNVRAGDYKPEGWTHSYPTYHSIA